MKKLTTSRQLAKLPPYLFVELDRKKREAIQRGVDIINLGIGDPDLPTPAAIVEKMAEAVRKPEHHHYPMGKGSQEFREAAARYMNNRFHVTVDPNKEIVALIGSKEGIGHLAFALVSPGQTVLVPDPGYPPYFSGPTFANAKPVRFALKEENNFLPDFTKLKKGAQLLFLNYPNNPTGASADITFLEKAVAWAKSSGTWLAYDAAYAQAYYDGNPPPSILKVPGAMDVAVEFHSCSKTYNMTGWRIGWACGNAQAIQALSQVKDNFDSGVFSAVQSAAAWALDHGADAENDMRRIQGSRRNLFSDGLKAIGWHVFDSQATFYLWCRPPQSASGKSKVKGETGSAKMAERILDEAGIVSGAGNGFGKAGEGYIRFALTQPEPRLREALDRLAKIKW